MYKCAVDKTPIVGKNWTLHFQLAESTGGHTAGGFGTNFTCASAVMWNVNFIKNDGTLNMYGHQGPSLVPIEERYALYDELIKRYKDNTFMVQLVGVVNGATAARLKHYLQSENKHGYHTFDFANYLITKKIGVVMESPVFINTYHGWEGPSICQAWMWFSPSIINQAALVEHTGAIHGLENVEKFLHDSEINKNNIGGFRNLLNPAIASEPRFAKAAEKWDAAMTKYGVNLQYTKKDSKDGELWKRKVV
jgi:hypothetical protein